MSVSWAALHVVRDVALANGGRKNTADCIADRALLICPLNVRLELLVYILALMSITVSSNSAQDILKTLLPQHVVCQISLTILFFFVSSADHLVILFDLSPLPFYACPSFPTWILKGIMKGDIVVLERVKAVLKFPNNVDKIRYMRISQLLERKF